MGSIHKVMKLGAGLLGLGVYLQIQNRWLELSSYQVAAEGELAGLAGMKILQLSDLHFPRYMVSLKDLLKQVKEQKPDYIFLTGDMIQGDKAFDLEEMKQFARDLISIAPTYAVHGNHEAGSALTPYLDQCLQEAGVIILHDSSQILSYRGQDFVIMGLQSKAHWLASPRKGMDKLKLNPQETSLPKILLAHQPELFESYLKDPKKAPNITFVGHAHGGQIRIPFQDQGLFAPDQGFLPSHTAGLHVVEGEKKDHFLLISRGIGASSFPFRVHNRPEIVTLEIVERGQAHA